MVSSQNLNSGNCWIFIHRSIYQYKCKSLSYLKICDNLVIGLDPRCSMEFFQYKAVSVFVCSDNDDDMINLFNAFRLAIVIKAITMMAHRVKEGL